MKNDVKRSPTMNNNLTLRINYQTGAISALKPANEITALDTLKAYYETCKYDS